MRRSVLPPAILLISLPGILAAQSDEVSLFRRYHGLEPQIDRARKALEAGRVAEAHKLLEPCLKAMPDHYEAHFLLARIAYGDRDYQGVLLHLDIAERSLNDLDRRYRTELADRKARDLAEEQAFASSLDNLGALGVDPTACSGYLYRDKQKALDNLEAKKGHLRDGSEGFGIPADYRYLRGNALYRQGRRPEALAAFQLTLATDPGHANAWNNLLALRLETHDLAAARADLAKAEAAGVEIRPALKQALLDGR